MLRSLLAACAAVLALAACGSGSGSEWRPEPFPSCPAPVVAEPVLPSEMVQDLGTLQVGSDVTFAVTTGTAGFFIFSQEAASSAADTVLVPGVGRVPNAVIPTGLVAPDGTLFYEDLVEPPTTNIEGKDYEDVSGLLAFDVGFRPVASTLAVPNTSGALAHLAGGGPPPGTWSFTVSDWAYQLRGNASARYRVHVVTRPQLGPTPTLDLEVYLATEGSGFPSAAGAGSHPRVARWRQSLALYLLNAGITLGEVRYHELAQELKDRYAPNGEVNVASSATCGALEQLFASAIVPRRAVHLFLADGLTAGRLGGGGSRVAGVTGSIPGPSGFPGTIYGGAIVAIEDFGAGSLQEPEQCGGASNLATCGPDAIAYVTAHEIGHWLGLYHTTEQPGIFFDPISDTERCVDTCAAGSGATVVMNDRCVAGGACGGGRNLMFWLLDPSHSTGELSPHQGEIARLNPAVR